jgi:signal transduction histidine kinase
MWRDISSGFVWRGDVKNKAKDDSYYWVRTTIVPILDTNEKPFQYIAIRYDITQQKDIEEKLNEALAQVTKNDKLKDEFASMVTHELKTPLTPIRGYCEMLTIPNLMGTLNKEQLDSIKEIEVNAKRLEVLIGDVLDAQKIDMNQMSFTKSKISTDELMKNISNNVSFMIKNKNIELVNKTENNSIITDKKRTEQVMYNLISNAVDFVPDKNGRIEIGTKKEGSEIIFYVKDNGIGIHKNKQADLFKKFYQVDTSAKRQHGGTGLGLTICKGIVEGLGGKIWVKSDLGQGTTFYFSLPEGDDK